MTFLCHRPAVVDDAPLIVTARADCDGPGCVCERHSLCLCLPVDIQAASSLLVPQDDPGYKLDDMVDIRRQRCREEALAVKR
jgi:hypothetical protein